MNEARKHSRAIRLKNVECHDPKTHLDRLISVNVQALHVLKNKLVQRFILNLWWSEGLADQFVELWILSGKLHPAVTENLFDRRTFNRIDRQHSLNQVFAF